MLAEAAQATQTQGFAEDEDVGIASRNYFGARGGFGAERGEESWGEGWERFKETNEIVRLVGMDE